MHWGEFTTFYIVFLVVSAFVQALPKAERVENPWAKFAIKFGHALVGNFGMLIEKYPRLPNTIPKLGRKKR